MQCEDNNNTIVGKTQITQQYTSIKEWLGRGSEVSGHGDLSV